MNIHDVNCKERFNFMLENCLSHITPKSVKEIHQELLNQNFRISQAQVRRDLISQENKNVICVQGDGREKKFKLISKSSRFDSTFAQFFYALHLHDLLPEEIKTCQEWLHLLGIIEKEKKKFVHHSKYNSGSANLIIQELKIKIKERYLLNASNDVSFHPDVTHTQSKAPYSEEEVISSTNIRAA